MTTIDQELVPAFLYESLPKPSEWIPDHHTPAWYPGVVWQSPPSATEHRPAPRRPVRSPQPRPDPTRRSEPPEPPATRRTDPVRGTESAASPRPDPLPPPRARPQTAHTEASVPERPLWALTPGQRRHVNELQRAYEAEEAIPDDHLPTRRLRLLLWKFLPVLWLVARCRHCGQAWPCHTLTRQLRKENGPDIRLEVHRLSTKRLRERSLRRNTTTITHRRKPRRVHRKEHALGLR